MPHNIRKKFSSKFGPLPLLRCWVVDVDADADVDANADAEDEADADADVDADADADVDADADADVDAVADVNVSADGGGAIADLLVSYCEIWTRIKDRICSNIVLFHILWGSISPKRWLRNRVLFWLIDRSIRDQIEQYHCRMLSFFPGLTSITSSSSSASPSSLPATEK